MKINGAVKCCKEAVRNRRGGEIELKLLFPACCSTMGFSLSTELIYCTLMPRHSSLTLNTPRNHDVKLSQDLLEEEKKRLELWKCSVLVAVGDFSYSEDNNNHQSGISSTTIRSDTQQQQQQQKQGTYFILHGVFYCLAHQPPSMKISSILQ